MIRDAARFVRVKGGNATIVFCGGRNAVNQHMVIEDSLLRCQREAQIFQVSCMQEKNGRQLRLFDVGHTVRINGRIGKHARGMEIPGLKISRFSAH